MLKSNNNNNNNTNNNNNNNPSNSSNQNKELPPSGYSKRDNYHHHHHHHQSSGGGSSSSKYSHQQQLVRKDLNRYLGTTQDTPPVLHKKDNLGLNFKKLKKLKSITPDQSPVDENITLLDTLQEQQQSGTSGGATSNHQTSGTSQDMSSLAVERPRKKLSFREPEIMGYYMQMKQGVASRLSRKTKSPKTSVTGNKNVISQPQSTVVKNNAFVTSDVDEATEDVICNLSGSTEDLDLDLESQAMRVVRTVGQAFEVCHKLSINSPSQEDIGLKNNIDDKDHSFSNNNNRLLDASHDLNSSDKETDLPPDKNSKKDLLTDTEALNDSNSTIDLNSQKSDSIRPSSPLKRPLRLDIIPPSSCNLSQTVYNHTTKRSPLGGSEIYSSPLSEPLKSLGDNIIANTGTPLSTHHELQLMREQLEQQTQQTQAAISQVHLLREQLQVETNARIESQARIHQLLSQNKELLDHIQSLIAHLQDQERLHQIQLAQTAAAAQQHQQQQQQQQQAAVAAQQAQQLQHNVNSTVPQVEMSPTSKVTHWFEATSTLPRQESGFVDTVEDSKDLLLLSRIPSKKRKKIMKMHKGNVKTF